MSDIEVDYDEEPLYGHVWEEEPAGGQVGLSTPAAPRPVDSAGLPSLSSPPAIVPEDLSMHFTADGGLELAENVFGSEAKDHSPGVAEQHQSPLSLQIRGVAGPVSPTERLFTPPEVGEDDLGSRVMLSAEDGTGSFARSPPPPQYGMLEIKPERSSRVKRRSAAASVPATGMFATVDDETIEMILGRKKPPLDVRVASTSTKRDPPTSPSTASRGRLTKIEKASKRRRVGEDLNMVQAWVEQQDKYTESRASTPVVSLFLYRLRFCFKTLNHFNHISVQNLSGAGSTAGDSSVGGEASVGTRSRFFLPVERVSDRDERKLRKQQVSAEALPPFLPSTLVDNEMNDRTVDRRRPFAVTLGVRVASKNAVFFAPVKEKDVEMLVEVVRKILPNSVRETKLRRVSHDYIIPVVVVHCSDDIMADEVDQVQDLLLHGPLFEADFHMLPPLASSHLQWVLPKDHALLFFPVSNGEEESTWRLPPRPPSTFTVRQRDTSPALSDRALTRYLMEMPEWAEPDNLLLAPLEPHQRDGPDHVETRNMWLLCGYTTLPEAIADDEHNVAVSRSRPEETARLRFVLHQESKNCINSSCSLPFSHPTRLHDQFLALCRDKYLEMFD